MTLVIAAVTAVVRSGSGAAPVGYPKTTIAVLPFQNLSTGESNAYFASGLHDQLVTQLGKVASLTVMGTISVLPYAGTTKSHDEISRELSVGSIVEATVQVIADRLRITVRLLDAATGSLLWSDEFNRTLDDAFAIQSEVAQAIVAEVGAVFAGSERSAIATAPISSAEAWRLYLEAGTYRSASSRAGAEAMLQLYGRALRIDPDFALAHAGLSHAHGTMFWFRHDPRPERAARQFAEAELALRLAPESPEAHWAMGMAHYWGHRDYRRAIDEMEIARRGLPNDAGLIAQLGYAHRRLGNWQDVDAAFKAASLIDPRSWRVFYDLGGQTFAATRRYDEAMRAYNRALTLAPHEREVDLYRGLTWMRWHGEIDTLRAVLATLPPDARLGGWGRPDGHRARLLLWERKPNELLALLNAQDTSEFQDQTSYLPIALYAAWAHELLNDTAAARRAFLKALGELDAVPTTSADFRVHTARGLVLAALGRKQDALSEARWLQQSAVYRDDAYIGLDVAESRAMILTRIGEVDAALDEIERALAGVSLTTVHTLRLNPAWDSLRNHPRFKALLVKYVNPSGPAGRPHR